MSEATNPTPGAEDVHSSSLVPVDVWQIDSTSQHVTMRLHAGGSSDGSIAAGDHGFRLRPEQARQIIRDLSAAVLAMDLRMLAGSEDAKDGDARLSKEAEPDGLRRNPARVIARPAALPSRAEEPGVTRPADAYLRLLELTRALPGQRSSLVALDPPEERILTLVARTAQSNERLSVTDLMAQSELGSPAALHGRVKSMRKKGWIQLADTEDRRRKQIELTEAAWRHLDRLSAYVTKALGG